ncbi:M10 family metallopeptidase C-terminal domain-containing protein [Shinella curvata]|uniref:M10 family metallopeptidase C-terminal domain-containing protein n=1 Tax=Shinella curvata TaxID=1817964 RepID=A0ABT8XGM5_9HYPH|nr:M10 family metallopeptidase C-terminal domain-containing protein [Shinella curvata]MCJ8053563.1 M10 family metallopeptidase C-terminal domain-containing protein [Shinella curvata]MDO6122895.1 M10 family metallopeptidase C-terminal domain-containing protein [Shinella curvata]
MSSITTDVSATLNGKNSFRVGDDVYRWNDRWITMVDVWADDNGPIREVDFTLGGNSWGTYLLKFSGKTDSTIVDKTTGTTDDNRVYIDFISFDSRGTNKLTLVNAEVGVINGYRGSETVKVGFYANAVTLGRGDDTLTLTGAGEVGTALLGRGDDRLITANGLINTVDMGRGNDTVSLGVGGADYIQLGRDADTIKFKALADPVKNVIVDGGEGISDDLPGAEDSDTVNFSAFSGRLRIDLNGRSDVETSDGIFTIRNFENAIGGKGRDVITANDDANLLSGGGGADIFVFGSRAAIKGDHVTDFDQGEKDRIDFSDIDANSAANGNQAFKFIAKAGFSDTAGELRYLVKSGDTLVQGDVNGDGKADFTLTIDGSFTLKAGDFIL